MNSKRASLNGYRKALAVAAALLLGLTGNAYATGLSQAYLSLTDFQFSSGGSEIPLTAFSSLSVQDKSSLQATIDGVGNSSTVTTTVTFPPLAITGTFPLGANECTNSAACTATNTGTPYVNAPTPPASNLGKADSNLTGSPLAGLLPGDPLVTAQTAALAQLVTTGKTAAASSVLTLSSSVKFAVGTNIPVTISFHATEGVTSFLDTPGFAGTSSNAWTLQLIDTTTAGELQWIPNGSPGGDFLASGSLVGPTVGGDPCSLQLQNSTSSPPASLPSTRQANCSSPNLYSLTTPTLIAGDIYTLDVTHTSDALLTLTPVVPEPATMFLLGFGLIGLAGFQWKRSRKAGKTE